MNSFTQRRLGLLLAALCACVIVWSQDITSTILVQDEENNPLSAVLVYVQDYSFSGETDQQGKIALPGSIAAEELITFSFVGYHSVEKTAEELRRTPAVTMAYSLNMLEEVEVIGRADRSEEEMIQQLQNVNAKVLALTNPQTSADALAQHGNLFVQKSQMGGGSPIIRGFEANKILLVVDGVRMNNAIYRNGHLQNSITVGSALLDRIEVLFGPGSLEYGSDAIGGVIHFRTREPGLSLTSGKTHVAGQAFVRYGSANEEKSVHADVEIGGRKFASLTSLSFSDFGDLRQGSNRTDEYPDFGKRFSYINNEDQLQDNPDPDVQVGTAYHQYDVLQKFKYRPAPSTQLVANLQYSSSGDVPRYDNLSEYDTESGEFTFSEWHYGPQNRFLASVKASVFRPTKLYDHASFIASFQRIDEDRITRRFGNLYREHQEEDVSVFALTADFSRHLSTDQQTTLQYGLETHRDNVSSGAFSENILSGVRTEDILTRYPDGESHMRTAGIYAKLHHKSRNRNHLFDIGLRYAFTSTKVRYERTDIIAWPEAFTSGATNNNSAFSGSLAWQGGKLETMRFRAMLSSAYRVPNVDDLAKIRAQRGNVVVPNLDLGPERSYTAEATLSKLFSEIIPSDASLQLDLTGFYTRLNDAIIREFYQLPNGDTTLAVSGENFRVQANVNADRAWVYGFSGNLSFNLPEHWNITSSLNYQKGRSFDVNDIESPLAHIPPFYGKFGIAYEREKLESSLVWHFNGKKPIDEFAPGSSDNEDLATPEGSLSWSTLNLYTAFQLGGSLTLNAAVENIFDINYRTFSSGVSAPGRNFVVSATWRF